MNNKLKLSEQVSKEILKTIEGGVRGELKSLESLLSDTNYITRTDGIPIKTIVDLKSELTAGKVGPASLGKLRSEMIKSPSVSSTLRTKLIDDMTTAVYPKYKNKTYQEIKDRFVELKYGEKEAVEITNSISKKLGIEIPTSTFKQGFNDIKSGAKKAFVTAPLEYINKEKVQIKNYTSGVMEKITALGSKMSPKQKLLYGIVIGGAAVEALNLLKDEFGDGKTDGILPSCIANLPDVKFVIGTGDVVVGKITDGIDVKSKGHNGLYFWPNGRAITGDATVKGTYYCSGTSGSEKVTGKLQEQNGTTNQYSNIHIVWDGTTKSGKGGGGKKSYYHDCSKKDFPYEFGCIAPKIGEAQKCLGLKGDTYFGPYTMRAIGGNSLTKEKFDEILKNCQGKPSPEVQPEVKPEMNQQDSVIYKSNTKMQDNPGTPKSVTPQNQQTTTTTPEQKNWDKFLGRPSPTSQTTVNPEITTTGKKTNRYSI